jgi:UDP-N-acetylglucosamine 4,6-dehydratase
VVHAAALKRVDALAYDPQESIRTNVLGAINVVDAALAAGVRRVLAVSTDKAAGPANLYGGTKLLTEHLFAFAHAYRGAAVLPWFQGVRYGNVLGSRGSVLHAWRAQADAGGPLRVTPGVTRFWVTLPQACRVVAWAAEYAPDGAVFVPRLPGSYLGTLARAAFPKVAHQGCALRVGGEKPHEWLLTGWELRAAQAVRAEEGPPGMRGGWLVRHGAPLEGVQALEPVTSRDEPLLGEAGCRVLLQEAGWA